LAVALKLSLSSKQNPVHNEDIAFKFAEKKKLYRKEFTEFTKAVMNALPFITNKQLFPLLTDYSTRDGKTYSAIIEDLARNLRKWLYFADDKQIEEYTISVPLRNGEETVKLRIPSLRAIITEFKTQIFDSCRKRRKSEWYYFHYYYSLLLLLIIIIYITCIIQLFFNNWWFRRKQCGWWWWLWKQ